MSKKYSIEATASNVLTFDCSNTASNSGLGRSISNAVYDIDTGLMTVSTNGNHGFAEGNLCI